MSLIRCVDVETTGMEPPAEVCEVGWCDYDAADSRIFSHCSGLHRVASMPPEVRAIHHIALADTLGEPPFDAAAFVANAVAAGVVAFAAHNMAFEAQWLGDAGGLHLVCTYKVALRIWPAAPAHNLGTLRYWLEDQGKLTCDAGEAWPPHRAGPDAYVTAHVLKALFEAGATGSQMVAWSRQPALLPTCPIGDHRGKPWPDVPTGFLEWMVHKAKDMDAEKIWNAQRELDRRAANR